MMSTSWTDNLAADPSAARRRCVLLWLAAAAIFAARMAMLSGFRIDDAYISFRYARNLAEGNGLVFNVGERVEGYSNLAWVLAIAPGIRAGFDPMGVARVLSVLCVCATFFVLVRWSARLNSGVDVQGALAPMGLALNTSFVLWTLGGLETQLMAACVTVLGYAVWRGRVWCAAAVAALLVIVRPEGVAYGVAAAAALLAIRVLAKDRIGWRWCAPAVGACLAAGAHMGWRLWYYGEPLPNVFYAKSGGTLYHASVGVDYAYECLRTYGHLALLALPLVTWLCRPHARRMLVAAAAMAGTALAFAAYAGGDWMPGHRFLVPAMPLLYFCVQEGARDVLAAIECARGRRTAAAVGVVAWTLFLFAHCAQFPAMDRRAGSFAQEAQLARFAGEWLGKRARTGATIAVADAGAIPYFSKLKTIDRRGLMDKHVARLRRSDFMWKCDERYVVGLAPDYIESQLGLSAALQAVPEEQAAAQGLPARVWPFLRRLPAGASLANYARPPLARWAGDMELYSLPEFVEHYRPVMIYKVPGLWHVVVSQRVAK